jgi:uncharacterized membrane protein YfcA
MQLQNTQMNHALATVGLGVISGLAGGALGQSGAEVMVPGLLVLGIVSNFKTAAGTVLLTILPPLSLMAIATYWKRNQVQVSTAVILMVTYFFAAWAGAYLTGGLKNSTLEGISGVYFMLIGAFFMWNSITGKYGGNDDKSTPVPTNPHREGFKLLKQMVS